MLRFVDWIWRISGSVALHPGQSRDDAFSRLDRLFGQNGTRHERVDDTLRFWKKDQAAQDKMAVFDDGVLHIDQGAAGLVLRYRLTSRALLFCFLAPLLFVSIAQLTIFIGKHEPAADIRKTHGKAAPAAPKLAARAASPMNPIDKALGAPAPEKPGKTAEDADGRDKKPSPTPAYVFAAMFATLYVAGRILEDRLVKALFVSSLRGG